MKIKIAFYTFGCRLNQSETSSLKQSLNNDLFKIVDTFEKSNIVIINTCTVTEKSDSDIRRLINKIYKINPKISIAITGCLVEIQKKELLKYPNIKWIVGNESKNSLLNLISKNFKDNKKITKITKISTTSFKGKYPSLDNKLTRPNIKIHDGCDNFCSYCIIPYVRGRARSRKFNDIINEANIILDKGFKEIVLTGINIGKYKDNKKNLIDLINSITNLKYDFRIRISSIEPDPIIYEFIDLLKQNNKICRFLHIPVQSLDNDILKLMNRKYKVNDFEKIIYHTYNTIPFISLSTDIITGFPGENDSRFMNTYKYLQKLPLSFFHVFSYSERPLTKSKDFKDKVSKETIILRSKLLRSLSSEKKKLFLSNCLGQKFDVLFETKKNDFYTGLTDNYIRVKYKSDNDLENKILTLRLDLSNI